MMNDLKITAIQFDIIWEDKASNFAKLEREFLDKMNADDSDLIVLPEMFATGFTMKPHQFWEDENGETFQWMTKWAKRLNTTFGGGIITKTKDNTYQNTFLIVNPDCEVNMYHKRHLFRMGAENEHYVKGMLPQIIDLNGWRINLQICYDLRFPVFVRNKVTEGRPNYDVIIYIANWPEARTYAWTNLLRARAIENQAFVVGVNRVGPDGNNISHSGESASVDSAGHYIQKPIIQTEMAFTSILSAEKRLKYLKIFPVLDDADDFRLADN